MRNTTRCAEIEQRFPNLISTIMKAHQVQAAGRLREVKPKKPASKKAS
jgi:hypothetical protein